MKEIEVELFQDCKGNKHILLALEIIVFRAIKDQVDMQTAFDSRGN